MENKHWNYKIDSIRSCNLCMTNLHYPPNHTHLTSATQSRALHEPHGWGADLSLDIHDLYYSDFNEPLQCAAPVARSHLEVGKISRAGVRWLVPLVRCLPRHWTNLPAPVMDLFSEQLHLVVMNQQVYPTYSYQCVVLDRAAANMVACNPWPSSKPTWLQVAIHRGCHINK